MNKIVDTKHQWKGIVNCISLCYIQVFRDEENDKYVVIISDTAENRGTSVINGYSDIATQMFYEMGFADILPRLKSVGFLI